MIDLLMERTRKDQVLMYHGTSSNNLQSILKNGIVPDPKQRLWSGENEKTSESHASKESIPNSSYWTRNFRTAYGASRNTVRAFQGKPLIVVALMMPESMHADEDDISFVMEQAIGSIFKAWSTFQSATQAKAVLDVDPNDSVVNDVFDYVHKELISYKKVYPNTPKPDREFFLEWITKTVNRMISYYSNSHLFDMKQAYELGLRFLSGSKAKEIQGKIWEEGWFEENVLSTIPSSKQAERDLIRFYDKVTRKYRHIAKKRARDEQAFSPTARITEPVTFSGRNRIICIFSIVEYKNYKGIWYSNLTVHYGTVPPQTEKDFSEGISERYHVIDARRRNRPQERQMEHIDRISSLLNEAWGMEIVARFFSSIKRGSQLLKNKIRRFVDRAQHLTGFEDAYHKLVAEGIVTEADDEMKRVLQEAYRRIDERMDSYVNEGMGRKIAGTLNAAWYIYVIMQIIQFWNDSHMDGQHFRIIVLGIFSTVAFLLGMMKIIDSAMTEKESDQDETELV